ncbi:MULTISPECIES: hypothetical protein [unclassified Bradyrhizobium]|uniref:hypothetical protein n=1 Tax=unclassified Bradyrhizobium TaxID=2631580 RepID=UPI002305D315|nr:MULTISPECIES: hypothetical protein [unclassified Bradyrhizobium]
MDTANFAEAFASMCLAESGSSGSSSSATRPYSLVSTPPIIEIDRRSFREAAKAYHGDEIEYIRDNAQEYSDFVSEGMDGEQPLLSSRPANPEARARAAKMGFIEVDADNMVLDPEKSDKWVRNSEGKWQRKGTAALYLSKADDSVGSDTEIPASPSTYDYEDDFM